MTRWLLLIGMMLIMTACHSAPSQLAAPESPEDPESPLSRIIITCQTDADCTVKNIGNCCGDYPACVNVDSPADPDAVLASCQASGRMSTCGFQEIPGCQCLEGQCRAVQSDTTLDHGLGGP
ncbi:MAG: hypothetical protein LBL59_10440 [Xanthomonadaceae bacterium]|jgi:hypothetical protein|nr:hypothetical protein [Xanthomonadaceae bacterium]